MVGCRARKTALAQMAFGVILPTHFGLGWSFVYSPHMKPAAINNCTIFTLLIFIIQLINSSPGLSMCFYALPITELSLLSSPPSSELPTQQPLWAVCKPLPGDVFGETFLLRRALLRGLCVRSWICPECRKVREEEFVWLQLQRTVLWGTEKRGLQPGDISISV